MPKSADSPPIPTYNIPTIVAVQANVVELLSLEFFACRPTGPEFERLVMRLSTVVPVPYSTLFESMRYAVGLELNDDTINRIAWRLAGNMKRLKRAAVYPWSRQVRREWAPIQVMEVLPMTIETTSKVSKTLIRKPGASISLKVIAGSPAGYELSQTWSSAYIHTLKAELGFDRFDRAAFNYKYADKPGRPLRDIRELTRLRFFGLFDPEASREGPTFIEVAGSGSTRDWNKKVMKMRQRIELPCPKGYELDRVPCHKCEMGYDQCKAACHPNTYEQRECPNCHRVSWFDPTTAATICIDCLARAS
jgi:hypothetical protein